MRFITYLSTSTSALYYLSPVTVIGAFIKTMSGQKRKEQRYDVMKCNSPAIKNDLKFSVC